MFRKNKNETIWQTTLVNSNVVDRAIQTTTATAHIYFEIGDTALGISDK